MPSDTSRWKRAARKSPETSVVKWDKICKRKGIRNFLSTLLFLKYQHAHSGHTFALDKSDDQNIASVFKNNIWFIKKWMGWRTQDWLKNFCIIFCKGNIKQKEFVLNVSWREINIYILWLWTYLNDRSPTPIYGWKFTIVSIKSTTKPNMPLEVSSFNASIRHHFVVDNSLTQRDCILVTHSISH